MCFDDRAADNIISYRTRSTTAPSNYSNNAAAVYTYGKWCNAPFRVHILYYKRIFLFRRVIRAIMTLWRA